MEGSGWQPEPGLPLEAQQVGLARLVQSPVPASTPPAH